MGNWVLDSCVFPTWMDSIEKLVAALDRGDIVFKGLKFELLPDGRWEVTPIPIELGKLEEIKTALEQVTNVAYSALNQEDVSHAAETEGFAVIERCRALLEKEAMRQRGASREGKSNDADN